MEMCIQYFGEVSFCNIFIYGVVPKIFKKKGILNCEYDTIGEMIVEIVFFWSWKFFQPDTIGEMVI